MTEASQPTRRVLDSDAPTVPQQRLISAFVGLADTLVADFDVVDFLMTLADLSVGMLGVDAAGLMLVDAGGVLRPVASSNEDSQLLELIEIQYQEGPCLDCVSTGGAILNVRGDEALRRWPHFARASTDAGFGVVHALPLRLRNQVIGSMNLFVTSPVDLPPDIVSLGQGLADMATIGLLQERAVKGKQIIADQLSGALRSRILIEQAKGVLAERAKVDMAGAFSLMRSFARNRGHALSWVAAGVVAGTLDVDVLRGADAADQGPAQPKDKS